MAAVRSRQECAARYGLDGVKSLPRRVARAARVKPAYFRPTATGGLSHGHADRWALPSSGRSRRRFLLSGWWDVHHLLARESAGRRFLHARSAPARSVRAAFDTAVRHTRLRDSGRRRVCSPHFSRARCPLAASARAAGSLTALARLERPLPSRWRFAVLHLPGRLFGSRHLVDAANPRLERSSSPSSASGARRRRDRGRCGANLVAGRAFGG